MITDDKELKALRRANITRQAEWPGGEHVDLAFRGIELAGEVGELMNLLKKQVRIDRGIRGTVEQQHELRQMLQDELGDVVICLDLVGMELNVPFTKLKPSEMPDTSGDLARVGNKLNFSVGAINGMVEIIQPLGPHRGHLEDVSMLLSKALMLTARVAQLLQIDLTTATVMKFNATSAKHNLKTRML